jgi:TFIIF-interacting CTD phosphatase-like protein
MNRDTSKIIVIDWDENAYQLQPRNALHRLKKWEGDEDDADLVYLASFLKSEITKTNSSMIFEF